MYTPKHVTKTVTRHEWIIGDEYEEHMTARDLADGIFSAERDMKELGIDTSYDDAYMVRVGDGAEVILYVDVKKADD